MKDAVFYLGLGTLFTHELDAMPNHEWRGMPFLGSLPDETAMFVFVVAHVPLFAVVVALVASRNLRARRIAQLGVGGFLVLHGLLHWLSSSRPSYEFESALSSALIFGGAALGAVYLGLELRPTRR